MIEKRRTVCWQGWKFQIPRRWDPVKLEGDYQDGHALFADALRPRLGLRWQTPRKRKLDPEEAVRNALRGEVGQLAADEAKPAAMRDPAWRNSLIYVEPEPPGRDLFSGFSYVSERLLQVAYHAHRRENLFADSILSTLVDVPLNRAALWSIFDLSCVIPAGMKLKTQQLNAGDLGLTFGDRLHEITIRQIAVAQLALQRQSLDGWIQSQQKSSNRFHVSTGCFSDISVAINDRRLSGRIGQMRRRLRYFWMWKIAEDFTTIGLHDADRDRLILLHGTEKSLLQVVADSIGQLQF